MLALIDEARHFPEAVVEHRQELRRLAVDQRPQALFISCADSRVQPLSITGARPGQVLELRTAGNIVPAHRPDAVCAVGATLEYALEELTVPEIVVWGHSHCGTVRGLIYQDTVRMMPMVKRWLDQAADETPLPRLPVPPGTSALSARAQQHLLLQLGHLRTYPVVARRLASGAVGLHAWFYRVETGETLAWQSDSGTFRPL
ncbi:carbonic anhydrase [Kitasatospora sp. NPDC089509]|uniref:carbonic anhydrase n=1 Tax=Kitasatospora sp. NPDC089509 TaxID=3364079 RepID=UPI0037F28F8B